MKKMRNMLKKGGVADVVTLIIIVGLVIALIAFFVVPLVQNANTSASGTQSEATGVFNAVSSINEAGGLGDGGLGAGGLGDGGLGDDLGDVGL